MREKQDLPWMRFGQPGPTPASSTQTLSSDNCDKSLPSPLSRAEKQSRRPPGQAGCCSVRPPQRGASSWGWLETLQSDIPPTGGGWVFVSFTFQCHTLSIRSWTGVYFDNISKGSVCFRGNSTKPRIWTLTLGCPPSSRASWPSPDAFIIYY